MTPQPCLVCKSLRFEEVHVGIKDYEYTLSRNMGGFARCLDCGLLALNPMPDAATLAGYYPPNYANIHEEKVWLHNFLVNQYFDTLHALFKGFLPNDARILDVGCAAGHFIGYLQSKESGWDVLGVDVNPHACKVATAKGRRVIHRDFESLELSCGSFDLIIMSHLIEHVLDPKAMLKKARTLLKQGGTLYIETPNTASLDYRLFGKHWGGLHFPRHTYLFSKLNMVTLLEDNGFPDAQIDSTLNMFGWALSLQNLLVERFNLKTTNGRIAAYPLMMLAFSPLVMLQKLVTNAGGMRIIATKRDQE